MVHYHRHLKPPKPHSGYTVLKKYCSKKERAHTTNHTVQICSLKCPAHCRLHMSSENLRGTNCKSCSLGAAPFFPMKEEHCHVAFKSKSENQEKTQIGKTYRRKKCSELSFNPGFKSNTQKEYSTGASPISLLYTVRSTF